MEFATFLCCALNGVPGLKNTVGVCLFGLHKMASVKSKAAISPWAKAKIKNEDGRARSRSASNKSFQRIAVNKLRKHRVHGEKGENELSILAQELTHQEYIMNKYFSEIGYKLAGARVDERLEEAGSEFVTSTEEAAKTERSIWRVEDAAKFEVKLLLRKIDSQIAGFARTAASLLKMEYGPLHTSLLINDEVLLEWNTSSLVEPESYDGINQQYPIMTSALHRVSSISLIKYNPDDEIDLIFEATKSKLEMLNALIQVISRYNGQYYYHAIHRNCQTFVIDALKAMGCEDPPKFQGDLRGYFDSLKAGNCQPQFRDHNALDCHVIASVTSPTEGQGRLSSQEKEYLLGQYFLYHIPWMTESENPEEWTCPILHCQMEKLERHIDEQSMIMHRFLRIRDHDTQGDGNM